MICAPYVDEEQVAEFGTVFISVKYISLTAHYRRITFNISVQQLIHIQHLQNLNKKYEIIIFHCIHIHT